jgi:hypothetical protein
VEVKLCWVGKDARLYEAEFEEKILEDINRLKGIASKESDRMFVLAAHSPSEDIEYQNGNESISLEKAINKIERRIGAKIISSWSKIDLETVTDVKFARLKYLHSFSWYF